MPAPYSDYPALWLIAGFPAIAALIVFFFSTAMRPKTAGWIATTGVGFGFLWAVYCFIAFYNAAGQTGATFLRQSHWTWLDAGFIQASAGFLMDRISGVFALIITGIGFLIHIFSTSYMEEEEGQRRYFGYLSLFVASMLILVLADNAFFMFLGWEGVGACSFTLIGHHYEKSENVAAALKAFFVTRLGDVFLVLGVLLLAMVATVDFTQLQAIASVDLDAPHPILGATNQQLLFIAGLLLLGGAAGKSAQLPLQTWLPDAMAGPTPVSALIHAATMVTAGVYLIARFHAVYALSPQLMAVVAVVGALTALYGATCALFQSDIKRILAFSTISQIGYMFLALGVGAFSLGLFHFFTHAFFKALLFLAAGTVIHSLHGEQNVFKMGGLRRELPHVYLATLAGAIALAGIPLTSGFFSKDAILWWTLTGTSGNVLLYGVGVLTALLTAIYSARFIYLVFLGEPRATHHVHHPSPRQTWPLYILAFFALTAGLLNLPGLLHWEHYYEAAFGEWAAEPSHNLTMELAAALFSGIIAIIGWFLGAALFGPKKVDSGRIIPEPAMSPAAIEIQTPKPYKSGAANFLYRAWDFDRLYNASIVRPYKGVSRVLSAVDDYIINGVYEAGSVIIQLFHGFVVTLQNARVGRYAAVMLLGAALIAIIVTFYGTENL